MENEILRSRLTTLYTLFDHDHLLSNITWLFSKLSKNSGLHHIRIGHDKAWWGKSDSDGDVYAVGELIEMVNYLVRNTHIRAFGSRQIYPPSLTLTQENDDDKRADVLDMDVSLRDGSVTTRVYCKADAFPFRVVTMPE